MLPQTGAKCSICYTPSSHVEDILLGTSSWEESTLDTVDNNVESIVMQNQEKLRESSGKRMQVTHSVTSEEGGSVSDEVVDDLLSILVTSAARGNYAVNLDSMGSNGFASDIFSDSVLNTLRTSRALGDIVEDMDTDPGPAVDESLKREKAVGGESGVNSGGGSCGGSKVAAVSASEQLLRDDASDKAMFESLIPRHLLEIPSASGIISTAFVTEEDELGAGVDKMMVGGSIAPVGHPIGGTVIGSVEGPKEESSASVTDSMLESEDYDSIVDNLLNVLDEGATAGGAVAAGTGSGTLDSASGAPTTMYNFAVTSKLPDSEYEILR